MIFKTSEATVTLMELNQYVSIWSNFVGYYKSISELNAMELSITLDKHQYFLYVYEHFIKVAHYTFCSL